MSVVKANDNSLFFQGFQIDRVHDSYCMSHTLWILVYDEDIVFSSSFIMGSVSNTSLSPSVLTLLLALLTFSTALISSLSSSIRVSCVVVRLILLSLLPMAYFFFELELFYAFKTYIKSLQTTLKFMDHSQQYYRTMFNAYIFTTLSYYETILKEQSLNF